MGPALDRLGCEGGNPHAPQGDDFEQGAGLVERRLAQAQGGVHVEMGVHEGRRHKMAGGVDLLAGGRLDGRRNLGDAAVHDGDVNPMSPGDFNGDGIVDGVDLLKWQREDGSPVGLIEWENNYGNDYTLAAVTAAVPEPSGLTLFAAGLLGMAYRRQKQA